MKHLTVDPQEDTLQFQLTLQFQIRWATQATPFRYLEVLLQKKAVVT